PSRKFPCKHALGLMLMWASGHIPEEPEPDWVHAWLDERAERARRAEQRAAPPAPKDEEAAAKRAQERITRVEGGAAELRAWLTDRVCACFVGFERVGTEDLRMVAGRMVGAQALWLGHVLLRAGGIVVLRVAPGLLLA